MLDFDEAKVVTVVTGNLPRAQAERSLTLRLSVVAALALAACDGRELIIESVPGEAATEVADSGHADAPAGPDTAAPDVPAAEARPGEDAAPHDATMRDDVGSEASTMEAAFDVSIDAPRESGGDVSLVGEAAPDGAPRDGPPPDGGLADVTSNRRPPGDISQRRWRPGHGIR